MPASALVAFTGWGGKPRQYSFDFISGEMWTGQYLWGYLPTAIAVFSLPLVLLGLERWRIRASADAKHNVRLLMLSLASLLITWLQPWQGGELLAIVWAVELWRWRRRREPIRPSVRLLAALSVSVAIPAVYYFLLGRYDPGWKLASEVNAAGAHDIWSWPWWAIALCVLPLAAPAVLAYRRDRSVTKVYDWQQLAVRFWPFAVLLVYLAPLGTFPYHSFQGLQLPLAILAVIGARAAWGNRSWRPAVVITILLLMIVPGTVHKADVFRNSVNAAGDPYYILDDERAILDILAEDPRPGGVLGPTYAMFMIPPFTGREAYSGPFSWTPDWTYRALNSNRLFEGQLTGEKARKFVISTRARWIFVDCRPLDRRSLEESIAPLVVKTIRRGCATLFELRLRPEMTQAAGRPDV
jgi:hypothetical protein